MKIKFTLTVLLALYGLNAMAQCNPAVPPTAVVINSTQTVNGGFDPLWVCSGDTLISDGGFHNIFLEPGAVMTTGGGIDTIYVKNGASFYMNGGIHVIYLVTPSDVTIAGGIPTLDTCIALTFDYTNAPANGCLVAPSVAFAASDSTLCLGDCISFINLSSNATSWQWSFTGADSLTSIEENPVNICYSTSGSFDVKLVASNGNGSDSLTLYNFITVFQPLVPTVNQIGDTLFSSQGFTTYQWYLENNIINGATNDYYVVTQGGNYTLVVTDTNGCTSSLLLDHITTQGITEQSLLNNTLTIFPNPASSDFTISINAPLSNARVEIYDVFGKIVYSNELGGKNFRQIHLNLASGIYAVKVSDEGKQWMKKLIIE